MTHLFRTEDLTGLTPGEILRARTGVAVSSSSVTGEWKLLSDHYTELAQAILTGSDVEVMIPERASPASVSVYLPAQSRVVVSGTMLPVSPSSLDMSKVSHREALGTLHGRTLHELAHAAFSLWGAPDLSVNESLVASTLEDVRCEYRMTFERPSSRTWLRMAAPQRIMEAARPTPAGSAPGLSTLLMTLETVGRALLGLLDPADVFSVVGKLESAFAPEALAEIIDVVSAVKVVSDTDSATMLALVRRLVALVVPPTPETSSDGDDSSESDTSSDSSSSDPAEGDPSASDDSKGDDSCPDCGEPGGSSEGSDETSSDPSDGESGSSKGSSADPAEGAPSTSEDTPDGSEGSEGSDGSSGDDSATSGGASSESGDPAGDGTGEGSSEPTSGGDQSPGEEGANGEGSSACQTCGSSSSASVGDAGDSASGEGSASAGDSSRGDAAGDSSSSTSADSSPSDSSSQGAVSRESLLEAMTPAQVKALADSMRPVTKAASKALSTSGSDADVSSEYLPGVDSSLDVLVSSLREKMKSPASEKTKEVVSGDIGDDSDLDMDLDDEGFHGFGYGGSVVSGTRAPKSKERILRNRLTARLRKLQHRERLNTPTSSMLPPGRMHSREAVKGAAERSLARPTTARPWKGRHHRTVETPHIRLAVLCDVSGSMGGVVSAVASSMWVTSCAVVDTGGSSVGIAFGDEATMIVDRSYKTPKDVATFPADGGMEAIYDALVMADRRLDLYNKKTRSMDPRIVVIVSDGEWVDPAQNAAANAELKKLMKSGVKVIQVGLGSKPRKHPCDVSTVLGKASDIDKVIGEACAKAMSLA